MGEWLPPNARAKGDSLLVLSTTTTTPRDPSAVSPSIRPMSRAVICAAGGEGRAAALGAAMVVSSCGPLVTATTTSACLGGASSGYVTPAEVGATSVVGSSDRPIVGRGTASITDSSATSEGILRAPVPACLTEGTGATAGGA